MAIANTDKHANAGARLYYASLAVTAMIQRCHDVCDGDNVSDIRAMPPILLTPFEPSAARTNPPSWFEFYAAGVTATRDTMANNPYHTNWPRIT